MLAAHPRGADVTARLVELDPRNADPARRAAADAGLTGVEVVTGDASLTDCYADLAPADLALACGIFGNISDDDIRETVRHCASPAPPAARCCGRGTGASRTWCRSSVSGSPRRASSRSR
ncbi:hypothetical protein V2I01_22750 [Micromonospora sp. BRA006-A]|nr:hypothetical protein [Micromonospora sp. BRA006-A]